MLLAKEQFRDILKLLDSSAEKIISRDRQKHPRHPPASTSTDQVSRRMSTWLGRCWLRVADTWTVWTGHVDTQCGRDGGASTGDSAGVQLLEMFSFRFWIFFSFKLISPAQIILSCCFLIKLSTYIIHCFYLSSEDRVAGGSRWPNIDCVWLLACWLGSCS